MFPDKSSKYQFSSSFRAFESKLDGVSVLFTVVSPGARIVLGREKVLSHFCGVNDVTSLLSLHVSAPPVLHFLPYWASSP